MSTKPQFASVKLPAGLVDDARAAAAIFSRSIAGQVEHWAKLGRAVEQSPGFSLDRAKAAIEGRFDPADLAPTERRYYYDLLDAAISDASEKEVAVLAAVGRKPGAAGYDGDALVIAAGDDEGDANE